MDELSFVAVDVETANPDAASICQLGVVVVENGKVTKEWKTLINPEVDFYFANIAIHGINAADVAEAPKFSDVIDQLKRLFGGRVIASHSGFDRRALLKAFESHGDDLGEVRWLDSMMLARRTWEQFALSGYGLSNLAAHLGVQFQHHDALEDAKVVAQIVLAAASELGAGLAAIERLLRPEAVKRVRPESLEANPQGPLWGEVVVFTGSLTIPRRDAQSFAAELGCEVRGGVSKKVTMLVVGDQDVSQLAGKEKSSKHLKAEQLISTGHHIRIVTEGDFMALASGVDPE
ncbi:exonuclease domain-containing protein [uncultured Microbulbifer sp.]|uniref:exonuclease domain-containing protein n=1 Tax=uncultured Microbulbifer sp. TaxID=348147 RepID=UPI0026213CB3|nr:exonuclease domain-containing protein [uncultured Microbulbifer sp.]